MEKIPRISEFKTPPGYFEQLPDQIMGSIHTEPKYQWIKYAAVFLLMIAAGIWVFNPSEQPIQEPSLQQEVNLYIDSQFWTAEDVLSLAENPNDILEQIILEEFPSEDLFWEEEQTWF